LVFIAVPLCGIPNPWFLWDPFDDRSGTIELQSSRHTVLRNGEPENDKKLRGCERQRLRSLEVKRMRN